MIRTLSLSAVAIVLGIGATRAQEERSLTRDEVSVIKKKLVASFEALGLPPGYALERENFNLPTETYRSGKEGRYNPIGASAERKFGTEKKTEDASRDLQKEYQKKLAEAQAKGDYAALSRLAMEMQQKAGEMQLKATEAHKEPIEVSVRFNSNPGAVIDPDAVLFERSGVIALKSPADNATERISIYFDPVALRETKQLSRVDMKLPEGGVASRTLVLSATIEVTGPGAEVEPWVKKIDTRKVLAQIDQAK